jgi:excisionase family DNA binding protein
VETQVGAAVNVSPMMAANKPTLTNMMNEFNKSTQTLMIVSKDDLENVVQNAVNRLLEKRENKPEVYLSVEETARRLKVDRSTLWRWNKDGYLTTTKVGNKVRYKLSDVERIQKGEVYE